MTNQTNSTLYIVDGSSYIYRAFYAVRGLTNSDGMPTNALYGFTQMLQGLLETDDPDYAAIAFDAFESEEETFRKKMYEPYKAHRPEMPEDLQTQLPYFSQLVEALNLPFLVEPGVEADDIIATVTKQARQQGLDVCIVSGDKDLMQLLGPHVWMHDTMKDKKYTLEDVEKRFNVPPDKVKYVLGLAGDSSDNIPGVPGIGETIGGRLIDQFGDLDSLYENLDKVGGKKRPKTLAEHEDNARLSTELVTLKDDCDLEFNVDDFKLEPPDLEQLRPLFDELEFQKPWQTIQDWIRDHDWDVEPPVFSYTERPGKTPNNFQNSDKDYRGIFSEKDLDEALEACRREGAFAFDLETTSLNALDAEIVGIALSWEPHQGVYIPCTHKSEPDDHTQLELETVLDKIAPLLESPEYGIIGQHLKYEWLVLRKYDVVLDGIAKDTMLMSYLLEPGSRSHGLDAIAEKYLDYHPISYEDVTRNLLDGQPFDRVAVDDAIPYACEDTDLCYLLAPLLEEKLEAKNLQSVYERLEAPLVSVLARMEHRGICVDRDILQELSDEFDSQLQKLREQIAEYAGEDVNPNSPKQLRKVLFDKLDLPVKKRTKTGPSTAKSVLVQLTDKHPLPGLILEYRSFAKLKNTYVDALPDLIHEQTGRIHTDFNQTVTATGRLSSSNPNLQNIPIRDDRGRQIRRAFVPASEHVLISADYSQVELRILAHCSKDPKLLDAFQNDRDIHNLTAAQIFDTSPDKIDKHKRSVGKTINYGVLYGMGPQRLARDLEISRDRARRHIDQYFERYEQVTEYFDELVEEATDKGYATTLFGRRRPLPGLRDKGRRRAFAERAAINTPIQGTAADIMKLAMIELRTEITAGDHPLHQLLQVHDELILEAPETAIDNVKPVIEHTMQTVVDFDVPLDVDIGVGPNWLEAK